MDTFRTGGLPPGKAKDFPSASDLLKIESSKMREAVRKLLIRNPV